MRTKAGKTYNSKILKRSRRLNILQSLLQIPQLLIDLPLSHLRILNRLSLKRLDSLNLPSNIICSWLEALEVILDLVDYGLVLEHGAVMAEINFLRLL